MTSTNIDQQILEGLTSSNMDQQILKGLTSTPKYVPLWFRYDKQGCIFDDDFITGNPYYYLHRSDLDVLSTNIQDMLQETGLPVNLIDMGSGNSQKSRIVINAILKHQDKLTYIPMDISPGMFESMSIAGKKMYVWFAALQNLPYDSQIEQLRSIAKTLSADDCLLVSFDTTLNTNEVQKAYLNPTGSGHDLYWNALWRLNNDYGANFDTDNFYLEAEFVLSEKVDVLSGVKLKAVSRQCHSVAIEGLSITLTIAKGEEIYLHEGEYSSCKYTEAQIRHIARQSGLDVKKTWTDVNKHSALCCMKLNSAI
ncbi:histidine N-alpha-methyltransferase-like [Dreissena polymorpha]|uniref:histidine N-alpha-methyltransferase-like n=1 Tax=Dreissena polymorpha TaxID=45954 RepID=UPI00226535D1|nr:histidine N-alpha-methyltransferase-like [Dreissena polymorpha]